MKIKYGIYLIKMHVTSHAGKNLSGLLHAFCAVVGALTWLAVGRFIFSGLPWLICFIGYPCIFIGFFGGILYIYQNKFS